MKQILFLTFLLLFTSAAFCQSEVEKIASAKINVRDILKDPDSAKFKDLRLVSNTEGVESVVGEVNGRNSFGGYTGFKPFCVTNSVVTIVDYDKEYTLDIYALTGALGKDAELKVRLKEEKRKLVRKLEDQARFSSEVIWTLLTNVIVEKQSNDEALDAAIAAFKARAIENGMAMPEAQATQLRKVFETSLNQTLQNKEQVEAIKRNPDYQKSITLPLMYTQTLNALKLQYEAIGY